MVYPGFSWLLLDLPGSSWPLQGPPGSSWPPPGSFWLLLYSSSWLLLAPPPHAHIHIAHLFVAREIHQDGGHHLEPKLITDAAKSLYILIPFR